MPCLFRLHSPLFFVHWLLDENVCMQLTVGSCWSIHSDERRECVTQDYL